MPAPDLLDAFCKTFIFGTHTHAHTRMQCGAEEVSTLPAGGHDVAAGLVNGKPCYMSPATSDRMVWVASSGKWWVSDKGDMLAGKASGWMCTAADTALTPDKISAEWTVYTGKGSVWKAAPKVRSKE